MKKSEFSARVNKKQKSKSARSNRYRHTSASARKGDVSSNSLRELRTGQPRTYWYSIADPHKPSWGVYTDYNEVARINPHRFKQFDDEHSARQWLEDIDNGVIDPVGAGFPIECVPRGSPAARSLSAVNRNSRDGSHASAEERALRSYNASPASKYGRAKLDKAKYSWYAVVIGRTPGVYYGYHLAWKEINGFTKGLAYTYKSYEEALEEFMRWNKKKRVEWPDSFMAMRGENATPFALAPSLVCSRGN